MLSARDADEPVEWAVVDDPACAAVPACPAPSAVDTPDRPIDDGTDDEAEEAEGENAEVLSPAVGSPAAASVEDTPLAVLDGPAAADPETFAVAGPFANVGPFIGAPLAVPAGSPEPPAWVVEEEWESAWVVSAWATPAPASTAAPTPTPRAPTVNQLDTGNTRPSRPAVSLLY
jgi:hypothetical protein